MFADGEYSDDAPADMIADSDKRGLQRAESIKGAMQHIWKNYKNFAWGADELLPRSGGRQVCQYLLARAMPELVLHS